MNDIVNRVIDNKLLSQHVLTFLDKVQTIFSRVETSLNRPFRVIDDNKLAQLETKLKELNEKMYILGRRDTNHTRKLMTLTMLNPADATYRVLAQILTQIEDRQKAIVHNYTKLKEAYVTVLELIEQLRQTTDKLTRAKLEAQIQSHVINISDTFVYLEAALKEVGLLEDAYEQIKRNKQIPDNWDEFDYEQAELEAHIKSAFRLGIRDFLQHGTLNVSTSEYFEQLGISPIEATYHISKYIQKCNEQIRQVDLNNDPSLLPDYNDFYEFLDTMYQLYKDSYKKACNKLGLDEIISKDFILLLRNHSEDN